MENNTNANNNRNCNSNTELSAIKPISSDKYIEQHEIEKNIGEMLNSLLHERDVNPFVYMVKYLSGFVSKEELLKHKITIPGPIPSGRPIVKYPKLNPLSSCLLCKYLSNKDMWHSIKHKKTKYGGNINNLTKLYDNSPNDPIGCIITDGDCLNTFGSLLYPIISDVHGITVNDACAFNNYSYDSIEEEDLSSNSYYWNKKVLNVIISFSRNVSDYPFNQYLPNDKRGVIKQYLGNEINELIEDKLLPECDMITYEENQFECDSILKMLRFNEDWMARANLKQNWPDHRVIFKTKNNDIVILINFIDHLRIYGYNKQPNINIIQTYNQLIQIVKQLDFKVSFETQKGIGFITSDIKQLGAGFSISSDIILNTLQKKEYFNELTNGLKYDYYSFLPNSESITLNTMKICKLSNLSQLSFFKEYCNTLIGLLSLDNDKSIELSLQPIVFAFPIIIYKKDNKDKDDMHQHHHYLFPLIKKMYNEHYTTSFKYQISSKGCNINNHLTYYINNPNKDFVLLLNDQSEYDSFSEFIYQYILNTQSFDIKKYDHIHQQEGGLNKQLSIPLQEHYIRITNVSICLMRNIRNYPFSHYHPNQNDEVEEIVIEAINKMKSSNNGLVIDYHPLTKDTLQLLHSKYKFAHLLHNDDQMPKYNIDTDYPHNRGIITFGNNDNIIGVINDIDHFKLFLFCDIVTSKQLDELFITALEQINHFSRYINFKYDMKLGFLTSNPQFLGTGLSMSINLILYSLPYERVVSYLKDKEFTCSMISSNKAGYSISIFNRVSIGIAETELYSYLLTYISDIVKLDNSYLRPNVY